MSILVLNAGSSSVKFALFRKDQTVFAKGLADLKRQSVTISLDLDSENKERVDTSTLSELNIDEKSASASAVLRHLRQRGLFSDLIGVGHRVVHGAHRFVEPQIVDEKFLEELSKLIPLDPEHLPFEIELMKSCLSKEFAENVKQVACFDTAFHQQTLSKVSKMLPIPRKFYAQHNVWRYGFHGLSYEYLMKKLREMKVNTNRVVLAHLGNGASMAAVKNGECVETSMCFTPTAGLVMSSRCGDIDPGVVLYLIDEMKMTTAQVSQMLNHESGLKGISNGYSDMRDLLEKANNGDEACTDAIEIFCRSAIKCIGAYSALLGGIDVLVFAGGIGENSFPIREKICAQLAFLGVEIDREENNANSLRIDTQKKSVAVYVIKTNEELMIVQHAMKLISDEHYIKI